MSAAPAAASSPSATPRSPRRNPRPDRASSGCACSGWSASTRAASRSRWHSLRRRSTATIRSRIAISRIASAMIRAPEPRTTRSGTSGTWAGPDQAARTSEDSLRWARQVDHANTTGYAFCGHLTNFWLRRPDRVERAAREALRLAEGSSLALWHAWALIHLGWALSQQGTAPGLDEIEAGLREARQIGAGRFEPFHLSLAADAYDRAGRYDEARTSIANAFAALAHCGDLAFAAELYRMRAVLLLRVGAGGRDAAEADFRRALEIARQQEARSLSCAPRGTSRMLAGRRKTAGRRPPRAGLWLVHRRFRDGGPRGGQGAARQPPCLLVSPADDLLHFNEFGCNRRHRVLAATARDLATDVESAGGRGTVGCWVDALL